MTKPVVHYTEAINLNSEHVSAYNNRGVVYARNKGEIDAAIQDL